MVAAMYILYGCATSLVCNIGEKVNGYLLDANWHWSLLKEDVKMREVASRLSSGGAEPTWSEPHRKFISYLRGRGYKDQFSRCLVSDINQALLRGDHIFAYPTCRMKDGSERATLRPMFELHAMSFLIERAGGSATNGVEDILDVVPKGLHDRMPFYAGCRVQVELAGELLKKGL